jgi:hypothetical protein
MKSLSSGVGIATDCGLDDRGVGVRAVRNLFFARLNTVSLND